MSIALKKMVTYFTIDTENGVMNAKNVIWSAGEYQYPSLTGFRGVEHCRHTATVDKYGDLEGDNFLIIGGYESGIDAAYHLARNDKQVESLTWKDRGKVKVQTQVLLCLLIHLSVCVTKSSNRMSNSMPTQLLH